jgi:hypothetical protein
MSFSAPSAAEALQSEAGQVGEGVEIFRKVVNKFRPVAECYARQLSRQVMNDVVYSAVEGRRCDCQTLSMRSATTPRS